MNKTLIGLVLIASLIGLVGGFGLGYVIYQPQLLGLHDGVTDMTRDLTVVEGDITSLQNQLSSLNSKVNSIGDKEWHEVYSLASSSDVVSGTFQLKGSQMRAMYIATSDYTDAWLSIVLHFSNGTEYAVWGTSGVWSANNAVLEIPQTGNFYLSITTYQVSYVVSFWDYY